MSAAIIVVIAVKNFLSPCPIRKKPKLRITYGRVMSFSHTKCGKTATAEFFWADKSERSETKISSKYSPKKLDITSGISEVDFSELKKLRQPTIFSSKNQFGRGDLRRRPLE